MGTSAAILTIGDELLAGQIDDTNGSWLAEQLTERGVDVQQLRTVADDLDAIERAVSELARRYTIVVTTGGLGSTPDDMTARAVAEALDRPLKPHPTARRHVEDAVAEIQKEYPEFTHDIDAGSQFPEGARIIPNAEGIIPGCVCSNIYVLPGIPDEMRAVFEEIRDEFDGSLQARTVHSDTAESHLAPVLADLRDQFAVRVGCYPSDGTKQIRLVGEDRDAIDDAHDWLTQRNEVSILESPE